MRLADWLILIGAILLLVAVTLLLPGCAINHGQNYVATGGSER
jgi:hypothetical protein